MRFGGKRVKVELTREKLDQLTANLLERTLQLTEGEIAKAKDKGCRGIDKLLLVGGSTYMPQVIEAVGARFPFEVRQFDPNQAVAKGAAIYGHKCQLEDEVKGRVAAATGQEKAEVDLESADRAAVDAAQKEVARAHGYALPPVRTLLDKKIRNVTSRSFGVVVVEQATGSEAVANLILVNEEVPATVTQQFGTIEDNQVQVDIRCMENTLPESHVDPSKALLLGRAELSFERPLPADSPVEISFDLAADGLLKMHGRDLTTGREIDAEFKTDSIMTGEQLEAAKSRNLRMQVA